MTEETQMIARIPLAGTDLVLTPDVIADQVAARLSGREPAG
jgi:hypothetical protein